MNTMSKSLLHFLSLILLCCVSSSNSFTFKVDNSSYFACAPHQAQALTAFMNEFDTSHCNLNDPFNGVWCDNSTGAVTMLQLQACLSGTLKPNSSLFRLHHLRHLVLRHNNFIPSSLPSEFGNLRRLEVLSLSNNSFVGQVPSSFSNLSLLSYLSLSRNKLTVSFPLLRNLSKLSFLDLSYNHFSGTLNPKSTSLFDLHHLGYLGLGYNNFSSSIPSEIGDLNNLEYLSLSSNDFFGQVPPTISNLTLLTGLYLYENQLTGSFPLLQNLTKLSTIDVSFNHFSGTIPSYLFTMPFLSTLDLRANQLSGTIPSGLGTLSFLAYINVSHNQLKGEIPQGTQITGQPKSSFEGNAGLCDLPLKDSCFETNTPPTQQLKQDDKEEVEMLNWKAVVIGYGPGVLLGFALAHLIATYKPEWLVKIIGPNKRRNC